MQVLCRGFLLYSTFSTGEILSNYSDGNSLPPHYKTFVNTVWYDVLSNTLQHAILRSNTFFFLQSRGIHVPMALLQISDNLIRKQINDQKSALCP